MELKTETLRSRKRMLDLNSYKRSEIRSLKQFVSSRED
ncbi:hypothetical protein SUSAZ_04930 [Sulfolobus acidocaldarius SUSAZ]|nr:hypothetical protein SUSAZ_04930 [Sulfolobus acidocaldarius SUSAZ]